MQWEFSVKLNKVSDIFQCKTYVKPAILTGLMPYRLRRGKQFYTNQTK